MGKEIIIGSVVALIGAANILNRRRGAKEIDHEIEWFIKKEGKIVGGPCEGVQDPEKCIAEKEAKELAEKEKEALVNNLLGGDCASLGPIEGPICIAKKEKEAYLKSEEKAEKTEANTKSLGIMKDYMNGNVEVRQKLINNLKQFSGIHSQYEFLPMYKDLTYKTNEEIGYAGGFGIPEKWHKKDLEKNKEPLYDTRSIDFLNHSKSVPFYPAGIVREEGTKYFLEGDQLFAVQNWGKNREKIALEPLGKKLVYEPQQTGAKNISCYKHRNQILFLIHDHETKNLSLWHLSRSDFEKWREEDLAKQQEELAKEPNVIYPWHPDHWWL